jgi:hypothetical protein
MVYPSSYFTDQFSDTDYLQSDDLPSLTTHCRTAESITPSESSRNPKILHIPASLTHVGRPLPHIWILREMEPETEQTRADFTDW